MKNRHSSLFRFVLGSGVAFIAFVSRLERLPAPSAALDQANSLTHGWTDVMRNSDTQKINLLFFIDIHPYPPVRRRRLYASLDRDLLWSKTCVRFSTYCTLLFSLNYLRHHHQHQWIFAPLAQCQGLLQLPDWQTNDIHKRSRKKKKTATMGHN